MTRQTQAWASAVARADRGGGAPRHLALAATAGSQ
jgi:hypothetical protein